MQDVMRGDRISDGAAFDPSALSSLPIFPLPNCVLLPGGLLPLHVFEPRYRDLTRDCLAGSHLMAIARLRPGYETSYYARPPVYERCGVRSEERRVGKECRSRGVPYHYKNKM